MIHIEFIDDREPIDFANAVSFEKENGLILFYDEKEKCVGFVSGVHVLYARLFQHKAQADSDS